MNKTNIVEMVDEIVKEYPDKNSIMMFSDYVDRNDYVMLLRDHGKVGRVLPAFSVSMRRFFYELSVTTKMDQCAINAEFTEERRHLYSLPAYDFIDFTDIPELTDEFFEDAKVRTPTQRRPSHPGEILREDFMRPKGISADQLAKDTGLMLIHLTLLIDEYQSMNIFTAKRLARYFGTSNQFWMNLQKRWDKYNANR